MNTGTQLRLGYCYVSGRLPDSDPAFGQQPRHEVGATAAVDRLVLPETPEELAAQLISMAERNDFTAIINQGVQVDPGFEARIAHELGKNADLELIYSDSVLLTGEPKNEFFPLLRPGFSPERLEAQMYLGDLVVINSRHAAEMLKAAQHYEVDRFSSFESLVSFLALRAKQVCHIPERLYRQHTSFREIDQREVVPSSTKEELSASIVIPTIGTGRSFDKRYAENRLGSELPECPADENGNPILAVQAVASVAKTTTYRNFEVVVVLGEPITEDLRGQITDAAEKTEVRFVVQPGPFNFSKSSNRGAVVGDGDMLVFLNDDTIVLTPDWLDRLAMYATRPEAGAVGAKLYYADGSIQHAGIWSRDGVPIHRYEGYSGDHGYMDSLAVPQNCLAVTGACLAVERSKFATVGGFTPKFPSSYNDVDLCLKLDALGWRTIWDPGTELMHLEASSRDPKTDSWERFVLHQSWGTKLDNDVYDNPNHTAKRTEELPLPTKEEPLPPNRSIASRIWPPPELIKKVMPPRSATQNVQGEQLTRKSYLQ